MGHIIREFERKWSSKEEHREHETVIKLHVIPSIVIYFYLFFIIATICYLNFSHSCMYLDLYRGFGKDEILKLTRLPSFE